MAVWNLIISIFCITKINIIPFRQYEIEESVNSYFRNIINFRLVILNDDIIRFHIIKMK